MMKKWHSGVESEDILNPALYKHHPMKTRWSSNSLVQRGRSGALSVTLSAALRVRGKPLNEVESWALLCCAVQTVQDRILQCQGDRGLLANIDCLLLTPERIRLTFDGNVELDKAEPGQSGSHEFLHPQVINLARLGSTHREKIALYSLGRCLETASVRPRSLQYLLERMTSVSLETVPHLLTVMREVEKFWREEIGSTPPSQLLAQLCQLTLGPRRGSRVRAPITADLQSKIEFSRLNTSSSSDSADEMRGSCTSLPKPPMNLPHHHALNSPFGASMPTLLDQDRHGHNLYTQNKRTSSNPRKYGKRLEFKPPLTGKLQRKFVGSETNLDKSKSYSATELPGLRSRSREKKANPRSLQNARRLYRIVRPLTQSRYLSTDNERERCVGPEFVVLSGQPIVQLDLTSSLNKAVTVMVVLLTGQRLELKIDPLVNNIRQLMDISNDYLRIDPEDAARLGLMLSDNGEWLYLAPDTRMTKILPTQSKNKEGICSLTLYQRFVLLPSSSRELQESYSHHLLYLQLRQDCIEGTYRADVSLQLAMAATAIHAEFGNYSPEVHGTGPYFLPLHYLPDHVRTLLGEREAREMLEKFHKTKAAEDLAGAERSFCHQIMTLRDYGHFFYTGRQTKKTDSPSLHFAIHSSGVYFFEISRNVFKPAKQMQSFGWKNIKEIQYSNNKMQFTLLENGGTKVKIYLNENKAKQIFDITESYHKQYLLKLEQSSDQLNKTNKQDTFRDFCRKVKRYTMETTVAGKKVTKKRLSLPSSGRVGSVKRSCSTVTSREREEAGPRVTIRRLAHYTSMAGNNRVESEGDVGGDSEAQYRYRVYLENEDDECHSEMETENVSTADYLDSDLLDIEDEKENQAPKSRRKSLSNSDPINEKVLQSSATKRRVSSVRMGTKVSAHALVRERLRSVTGTKEDLLLPSSSPLLSRHPAWTVPGPPSDCSDNILDTEDVNESLSMSLLERFDQMETEEGEPERRIISVSMEKDEEGRLGIKISGTPSGIYIDNIDLGVATVSHGNLKVGDRIIAVNNRSLENVNYYTALDIIRAAGEKIEFLVSQVK